MTFRRRLLVALFLVGAGLAHADPEDFQSPLRFGLDLQYASVKIPNYFPDGLGGTLAPSQSGAGFWFEWLPLTRYGKLGVGIGYQYIFYRDVAVAATQISKVQAHVVQAGVSYRADFLRSQYVVPYARVSVAAVAARGVDSFVPVSDPPYDVNSRYATYLGPEVVLGGQLLLDWIEPRAAANLDRDVGINNVYLFGEFVQFTAPLGVGLDLSYRGWRAGMRFEF